MTQYTPAQALEEADLLCSMGLATPGFMLRSLADQLEQAANWKRRAQDAELMAECTSMLRSDLIEAGVIDETVPPMMLTEAILGALQKSHELGFLRCAGWSQRDDLFADVGSAAYRKDRAHDLANIAAAPAVPAPGASAWLPIETAPKDGTPVIVGICGLQNSTGEAHWWQGKDGRGGWQTWDGANGIRTVYTTPPTHWMPLPPAPGAQAAPVVNEWPETPMTQDQFNAWFDALPWYIRSLCTPNHLIQAAPVAQLSEPLEGWVWVPKEPTEKMLRAVEDAGPSNYVGTVEGSCRTIYAAFIAAAPTTPNNPALPGTY